MVVRPDCRMNWGRLITGLLVICVVFVLLVSGLGANIGGIELSILAVLAAVAAWFVVRSSRRKMAP